MMQQEDITNLDDFVRSRYFAAYRESILLGYADRATHYESLMDMRDALEDARMDKLIPMVYPSGFNHATDEISYYEAMDSVYEAIGTEIDGLEAWHAKNGSLH